MREVVAYPDAERAAVLYLRPHLPSGVGIDVRGGGGRFVRVRRIGGLPLSPAHDRPTIDVLCWHDSDHARMELAQLMWGLLRAAAGDVVEGTVLSYAATLLGPRQMPDPADPAKAVCMFSVDLVTRNA